MIISINLIRTTFFFIEDVTLIKGTGPVDIDISTRSDVFINAICAALRSNIVEANIEIQDLVRCIKDIPFRVSCQRNFGLTPDTISVVEVEAEVEAEPEIVEEIKEVVIENLQDEKEEKGLLIDLLDGTIKQVTAKIRTAELSDEQRLELIELEEANKNRAIVIAAINEA
jgi:hypothetical protein